MPVTISGTSALILQAVQATSTTVQTITTQAYVDLTGLSVNITPSSTASRIKISVTINASTTDGTAGATQLRTLRNGTEVGGGTGTNGGWGFVGGPSFVRASIWKQSWVYIDSPATTSTLTYKVQAFLSRGAGTFVLNQYQYVETWSGQSGISIITVEELAQ
jgi:hypothetical protein